MASSSSSGSKRGSGREPKQAKREARAEKKRAKKEKKLKKKAQKAAKKVAKAEKKLQRAGGKKRKALSSASSSDGSSSDASVGFVMDAQFSNSGKELDPRNPNVKIQKALGLSCGDFGFVEREDDAKLAEEGYQSQFKTLVGEDKSRDWICEKPKMGAICGFRNFVKNETCGSCNTLRPRTAQVMQSRDLAAKKLSSSDGNFYR